MLKVYCRGRVFNIVFNIQEPVLNILRGVFNIPGAVLNILRGVFNISRGVFNISRGVFNNLSTFAARLSGGL
jgi:hypothetical protein